MKRQKLSRNGYRFSKNGTIINSIEKEAVTKVKFEGNQIKENGTYFFFNRKQGETYIYLP